MWLDQYHFSIQIRWAKSFTIACLKDNYPQKYKHDVDLPTGKLIIEVLLKIEVNCWPGSFFFEKKGFLKSMVLDGLTTVFFHPGFPGLFETSGVVLSIFVFLGGFRTTSLWDNRKKQDRKKISMKFEGFLVKFGTFESKIRMIMSISGGGNCF